MIIVRRESKPYPTKTIVKDLFERRGEAGPDDWTPFAGQADEFDKQFPINSASRIWMDVSSFLSLKHNSDFNPRMWKKNDKQFLEEYEGDSTAAAEYFKIYCIGYKKRPSGNYLNRKGTTFETLMEDEDTGGMVYGSDLHVDFEETPDLDHQQLFDRLTYLVKQIWEESIRYKASLFAFAFAFYQLKGKGSISRHSFKEFAEKGLLLELRQGVLKPFIHEDAQKYTIYPQAMDLFILQANSRVYKMCTDFLQIMVELGFDPAQENPYEYNEEFCMKLPCMYIETSSEFMRGAAFMNQIMHSDINNEDYFFSVADIEDFGYISRLNGLANIVLNTIRTQFDTRVNWLEQVAYHLLSASGSLPADEDERSIVVQNVIKALRNKVFIKDGIVYEIETNKPLSFQAPHGHSLSGCQQFTYYILSSGDLICILMNKITLEVRSYYSITTEGGLGYAKASWYRLDRSESV